METKLYLSEKYQVILGEENNIEISKTFVEDNKTEVILISDINSFFFGEFEKENCIIGRCSNCNSYFFCGSLGSYHCRKCGIHEGDHDLLGTIDGINKLEEVENGGCISRF